MEVSAEKCGGPDCSATNVELEEAVINEGYLKGEQHADHSVTKRDLLVQPFHQLPMRSLSGLSLLFGHQPDPLILILLIWQRYHQCESCFMTTCHRNHKKYVYIIYIYTYVFDVYTNRAASHFNDRF